MDATQNVHTLKLACSHCMENNKIKKRCDIPVNVQKLAEEVLNGRSRINGNGVGQFFSLSAPLFLYLHDMDGTSPYKRCSVADQG